MFLFQMMLTNSAEHLALLNFLIYNKHFPPRIYSKTMDHPSLRLKSWDWNNSSTLKKQPLQKCQ